MRPETASRVVARWVRFYTRDLPAEVARRRVEELDADLHEHIAHDRAHGTGERRIALGIASRMVRGLPADVAWHRHTATTMRTALRSTIRVAVVTGFILLIPLVAMRFSDEVIWGFFDFVFAAVLLGGTGLVFELAVRKADNIAYRVAAGIALAAAFLLVWVVAAVGVIGEDGDPFDLMYGGVLAVGIAGAAVARFRPAGMARALVAMALAQALVTVIAVGAGKHEEGTASLGDLVGVNAFFAALFLASALLFRRAARRQAPADA